MLEVKLWVKCKISLDWFWWDQKWGGVCNVLSWLLIGVLLGSRWNQDVVFCFVTWCQLLVFSCFIFCFDQKFILDEINCQSVSKLFVAFRWEGNVNQNLHFCLDQNSNPKTSFPSAFWFEEWDTVWWRWNGEQFFLFWLVFWSKESPKLYVEGPLHFIFNQKGKLYEISCFACWFNQLLHFWLGFPGVCFQIKVVLLDLAFDVIRKVS